MGKRYTPIGTLDTTYANKGIAILDGWEPTLGCALRPANAPAL